MNSSNPLSPADRRILQDLCELEYDPVGPHVVSPVPVYLIDSLVRPVCNSLQASTSSVLARLKMLETLGYVSRAAESCVIGGLFKLRNGRFVIAGFQHDSAGPWPVGGIAVGGVFSLYTGLFQDFQEARRSLEDGDAERFLEQFAYRFFTVNQTMYPRTAGLPPEWAASYSLTAKGIEAAATHDAEPPDSGQGDGSEPDGDSPDTAQAPASDAAGEAPPAERNAGIPAGGRAQAKVDAPAGVGQFTDRHDCILVAMLELSATNQESRKTIAIIARRAEAQESESSAVKQAVAELTRRGHVNSKTGRGGGCWLTVSGLKLAKHLQAGNG